MDPAPFPVLLAEEEANRGVWGPAELFVDYLNRLLRAGVQASVMPGAFLDLYALDFYCGQVRNGGHSQFVGNSGGRWQANIEHAMRGATMLDLPTLAQLLGDCGDWCAAHPRERDQQDGSSHRAVALDDLDDRFFAMDFRDGGYERFVAAQSERVKTWITSATEASDYQARSPYLLSAGAWLLDRPGTRLMPGREMDAALKDVLRLYAAQA